MCCVVYQRGVMRNCIVDVLFKHVTMKGTCGWIAADGTLEWDVLLLVDLSVSSALHFNLIYSRAVCAAVISGYSWIVCSTHYLSRRLCSVM